MVVVILTKNTKGSPDTVKESEVAVLEEFDTEAVPMFAEPPPPEEVPAALVPSDK